MMQLHRGGLSPSAHALRTTYSSGSGRRRFCGPIAAAMVITVAFVSMSIVLPRTTTATISGKSSSGSSGSSGSSNSNSNSITKNKKQSNSLPESLSSSSSSSRTTTSSSVVDVSTAFGTVRGLRVDAAGKTASAEAFLGLRFAHPPVGALRFAPAQLLRPNRVTDSALWADRSVKKNDSNKIKNNVLPVRPVAAADTDTETEINNNTSSYATSSAAAGAAFAGAASGAAASPTVVRDATHLPTVVRDATAFGMDCYQGGVPDPADPGESEDCLYLNIWRPANTPPPPHSSSSTTKKDNTQLLLPVMVWVYGGGFMGGSGATRFTNGAALAASQNVIVVSFNYRLGVLGFMVAEELTHVYGRNGGANGIHDQIVALQWVRDNIHSYGGNAERVTVFGQSAGGESVCVLNTSPLATGLFTQAISMSGPCAYSYWQPHNASYGLELGRQVFASVNATDLKGLRAAAKEDLWWPDAALNSIKFNGYFVDGPGPAAVMPVSPTQALETNGFKSNAASVILGGNSMDGVAPWDYPGHSVPVRWEKFRSALHKMYGAADAALVAEQYNLDRFSNNHTNGAAIAYVRADADNCIVCAMQRIARALAHAGAEVRLYNNYLQPRIRDCDLSAVWNPIAPRDIDVNWTSHGMALPFFFNTTVGADTSSVPLTVYCPFAEHELPIVALEQGYFASFARTGVPTAQGGPSWPLVNESKNLVTMRLGAAPYVQTGHRMKDCAFWEQLPRHQRPL